VGLRSVVPAAIALAQNHQEPAVRRGAVRPSDVHLRGVAAPRRGGFSPPRLPARRATKVNPLVRCGQSKSLLGKTKRQIPNTKFQGTRGKSSSKANKTSRKRPVLRLQAKRHLLAILSRSLCLSHESIRPILFRLQSFFRRRKIEAELSEEIARAPRNGDRGGTSPPACRPRRPVARPGGSSAAWTR